MILRHFRPFTTCPLVGGEGEEGRCASCVPQEEDTRLKDPLSGEEHPSSPSQGAPVGPRNPITCKAQLRARPSLFPFISGSCAQTQARARQARSGDLTDLPHLTLT